MRVICTCLLLVGAFSAMGQSDYSFFKELSDARHLGDGRGIKAVAKKYEQDANKANLAWQTYYLFIGNIPQVDTSVFLKQPTEEEQFLYTLNLARFHSENSDVVRALKNVG